MFNSYFLIQLYWTTTQLQGIVCNTMQKQGTAQKQGTPVYQKK